MKSKVFALLTTLVIVGCNNKATYDNIMLIERRECLKQQGSAYDKCMEQLNKSYEEYQRERQELLDEENTKHPKPL